MVPVRFLYQAGIHRPELIGPEPSGPVLTKFWKSRTDSGGPWIPDTRSLFLCPCSSLLHHVFWVSLGYIRDPDGPRTTSGRSGGRKWVCRDGLRRPVWGYLMMLFRWNVIQMQTLMFVSFAFYSATNIVFADVKDGKKLSIQLIRVGRTEFDGSRGSTSEFLSIFLYVVFVRNN